MVRLKCIACPFIFLLISVTLVLAACGGSSEEGEPTVAPAAERPGRSGGRGPPRTWGAEVPAAILAADYAIDEAEADSRYRGKDLQVSGLISEVGLSVEGLPYVALSEPAGRALPVQCIFDDETADISSLGIMQKGHRQRHDGRAAGQRKAGGRRRRRKPLPEGQRETCDPQRVLGDVRGVDRPSRHHYCRHRLRQLCQNAC